MRKAVLFFVFTILITGVAFTQFQLEPSFGYFFNTDTYEKDLKRSFNGLNTNITMRYLFTENIGIFVCGDFKFWDSANNDDYAKFIASSGMKATIKDDSSGYTLNLNLGLALAYPVNEKLGFQADIGLSNTVLASDYVIGTLEWSDYYYSYKANVGYFIDGISSLGFYSSIFGRVFILSDSSVDLYLSFGARIDYKFTRIEKGEIVIAGVEQKFNESVNDYSGFSIAPFVGILGSFK